MVEFLIRLLSKENKLATLSRGYGRKTKGFLEAGLQVSPDDIGDEPFQIFQKYGNEISVFVGEDRVKALDEIAAKSNSPELLLLDDAFQHRYVNGDLKILLTTYQNPFFTDFLLPMGRLRESRTGAKRADVVICTKCPEELPASDRNEFKRRVSVYCKPTTPVLFSSISYATPVPLVDPRVCSGKVILLTGLANDQPLVEYVSGRYDLLEVLSYPDHHDYTEEDFRKVRACWKQHASQNPVVLTTEKDAVKVKSNASKDFLKEIPIFVLPIEMSFSSTDVLALVQLIQQKVFEKDNS